VEEGQREPEMGFLGGGAKNTDLWKDPPEGGGGEDCSRGIQGQYRGKNPNWEAGTEEERLLSQQAEASFSWGGKVKKRLP